MIEMIHQKETHWKRSALGKINDVTSWNEAGTRWDMEHNEVDKRVDILLINQLDGY